ncbi:MFS transporter [Burkholderia multivorans]|uniref:MFS transporter n=1 Tax=Burkholderia multivorans TaxID=87883 RepID=UPI002019E340|nr:MFS transporter [Burkholderia multivorans]MCO1368644.1 MFS transporter [Burkholderia multivorans]MCO1380535.1 MFS transporter [Burkholderia multivorans]MDN8032400.1 MFS transporter [Burkholderia multivorans]UQP22038.1 MFS transporter [Burkholderia multivorans]UQP91514.1 MFS transporter [Burkholderia multivorans]
MLHATSGTSSSEHSFQAHAPFAKVTFSRLSVMMLLQFILFGSWFATLGLVLATYKMPGIIGVAYTLSAIAAIVSPIFLGAIGDRYLASQKVLGLAHLVGAALMLTLPSLVKAGDANMTLVVIFAYMMCFQPTLGLSNSIAFRHLGKSDKAFPFLRVFATVGWVIAGLTVGALGLSASTGVFTFAAIVSVILGLYSFTLPATPPCAKGAKLSMGDLIGAKSFVLFKERNFSVLILCAFLTSISLGVYNTFASPYLGVLGISNVAGVLAIGQASEVLFIISVPFVLHKLGLKRALLLGMGMWGVRFVLFAMAAGGHPFLAVVGVALHGICNDFFLILAAMFIDAVAPAEMKAQAQSWLIIAISGFGSAAGSFISGTIFSATVARHPEAGAGAWTYIWLVPIVSALITAFIWITFFRSRTSTTPAEAGPVS